MTNENKPKAKTRAKKELLELCQNEMRYYYDQSRLERQKDPFDGPNDRMDSLDFTFRSEFSKAFIRRDIRDTMWQAENAFRVEGTPQEYLEFCMRYPDLRDDEKAQSFYDELCAAWPELWHVRRREMARAKVRADIQQILPKLITYVTLRISKGDPNGGYTLKDPQDRRYWARSLRYVLRVEKIVDGSRFASEEEGGKERVPVRTVLKRLWESTIGNDLYFKPYLKGLTEIRDLWDAMDKDHKAWEVVLKEDAERTRKRREKARRERERENG